MDEILKQYNADKKRLEELCVKSEEERRRFETEVYKLDKEAYIAKELIDDATREKKNALTETYESGIRAEIDGEKSTLVESIYNTEKKFTFFEIKNMDLTFEVYSYSDRDENGKYIPNKRKVISTAYDVLVYDAYKKIEIHIVADKNKPKNKFALNAYGRTIFASEKFKIQSLKYGGWVAGINTDFTNIEKTLRHAPSEDELKKWYEKNKATILEDYLKEHAELEREYIESIEIFKSKEWQLAYWIHRKNYLEFAYSRGRDSEEYLEAMQNIERLKKEVTK